MALRGNLKDFSLPDVFQLVTFSKKTGVLRIRRADDIDGSVWFRDGDVFFAQSNWHRAPLGERMVAAERITQSALDRALELRKAEGPSGRRLGQILVDEGYVSDKLLETFVQEQIQDTIFDLMRWDEGDFDFEDMPEAIEEDIGLSVSIENIVMEGARRLEEWNRIKKKVPSMDIVFKMATAPGEGTFEISLKPTEWRLLLLVDGTRSVAQLAGETSRTDFEVARIIYGLFSAGLLEIATDEEVVKLRADSAERQQRLASIRRESDLAAKAKSARTAEASPVREASPVEEPEFLAGSSDTPTAEDMAVFERMMGAVLETPETSPGAETTPVEPEVEATLEPAPEPEPPEEAFMAVPEAPAEVTGAFSAIDADTSAPEPGPEPEPEEAPEPGSEPEPAVDEEAGLIPPVDDGSLAELLEVLESEEPAAAEQLAEEPPIEAGIGDGESAAGEAAEPPAVELTGDLERDLMALGLGELPIEEPRPPVEEPELPVEPASIHPPGATDESVEEPVEAAGSGSVEGVPDHEAWAVSGQGAEAETAPSTLPHADAPEEVEPDFSDLLSSLESSEEVATSEADSGEPTTGLGVDEDASSGEFERIEGEIASSGVISTDAFLDEIGGMEMGTGMGDELAALTGGGSGRQRPAASVKPIPESSEAGGLHMDQTVDKELVERIIEGIKSL